MWYKNINSIFFRFVTKHACDGQKDGRTDDRQTDRQNYDPQDGASIATSRGKNRFANLLNILETENLTLVTAP